MYYLVSFHGDLQKLQLVESDLHRNSLYTKARLDYMEAKRFIGQAVKAKMDVIQSKWVLIKKSMRMLEHDLSYGSFAYSQQVLSMMGKDIEVLMRDISEVAAIGKGCVAAGAI